MNNFIEETIVFHYTPSAKAKLRELMTANFKQRTVDDLIILEDLPKNPDELVGEENFQVKK